MHELHHGEYRERGREHPVWQQVAGKLLMGIDEETGQHMTLASVSHRFSHQNEYIDFLGTLQIEGADGLHEMVAFNRKLFEKFISHFKPTPEMLELIVAHQIFDGVSELVAQTMSQTVSLINYVTYGRKETLKTIDDLRKYHNLKLTLPPMEIIKFLEQRLTCEIDELGSALEEVYYILFDRGLLLSIFHQQYRKFTSRRFF